jgi:alkanesulfonate monooxygenase SsuD/methylene tetrahydromethanopterin reductase-like flavin-dependent oxidoreductase (luciferase family)
MRIGIQLPHFSDESTHARLLDFAPRIEQLGFDSVWARDNLSFKGHGFEHPGKFVDPFITLAALASVTSRVKLGTAVTVPFRHPLVTAQLVGSLSWISRGRFELGIGPGSFREPFELTGTRFEDRIVLCRETVDVLRAVARGPGATYQGKLTHFAGATIDPAPPDDLFIWYGGGSSASVRRAIAYCDGLNPGLCPFRAWDEVVGAARRQSEAQGRNLRFASIPLLSLGKSYDDALAKVDRSLPQFRRFLESYYRKEFPSVPDLAGALLMGDADDIGDQLCQFSARGVDLVVIDARLIMREFEEVIEQIGKHVLPAFS